MNSRTDGLLSALDAPRRKRHESSDADRERLSQTRIILDGCGSIARPLAMSLAASGARRFVLSDPKTYVDRSVESQCEPHEVGRYKTEVVASLLRERGAAVDVYTRDLSTVPEGIIAADSLVIASLDNARATILSNRRVARRGARLMKINIEPAFGVLAVRAFDYRRGVTTCCECGLTGRHYERQLHPRSCDGPGIGRRTNSPRWLSTSAAVIGVSAVLDLLGPACDAATWIDHEVQITLPERRVVTSRLSPNPNCRCDHRQRWGDDGQIATDGGTHSLDDLFVAAECSAADAATVRFCQRVATRGRCQQCGRDAELIRWFTEFEQPLAWCEGCGGPVVALPFFTYSELTAARLKPVWHMPLSTWGVERFALVEIAHGERRQAFVVDCTNQCPGGPASTHCQGVTP